MELLRDLHIHLEIKRVLNIILVVAEKVQRNLVY